MDNTLNNSLSVVVKESRASLSKSRNQLVQGLKRNRIENSNQAAKQPFKSYQANLIEEVHDLLFSCLVRDKLILNYIIMKYEQAIVFTYIGYNVHTNVAGQLISRSLSSKGTREQRKRDENKKFHLLKDLIARLVNCERGLLYLYACYQDKQ